MITVKDPSSTQFPDEAFTSVVVAVDTDSCVVEIRPEVYTSKVDVLESVRLEPPRIPCLDFVIGEMLSET